MRWRRRSPVHGAVRTSHRGTGRISWPASRFTWCTRIPRTVRTASAKWRARSCAISPGSTPGGDRRIPFRTPRFDLAVFPGCDSEFGSLDVSSVPLTFDSGVYDPEGAGDFALRVGDDLTANGLTDTNKKYLVYYDGPAGGGVCGRSASSSVSGGPRRVSFVYLQGDPGCRVGGFGTGNGWPARSAAHELLHAFNDYFAPDTAPNACEDRGHVCDSTADILSTGTSHPVTAPVRCHPRRRARRLLRPQR